MSGFFLDAELLGEAERGERPALRVWHPAAPVVVLGRAGRTELEVRVERCRGDGVPVRRRLGGGGAVVLAPGCLVVGFAWRVARPLAVDSHMAAAVERVKAAVEATTGLALQARGTGDLCVGDRKVLGSSLFCRRELALYQASLLVSMDLALVDRYLLHPPREPAYRRGRPHGAFLTSLGREGCSVDVEALGKALQHALACRRPGV
ncbi:MAG: hypothetical protein Kow0092_06450 [Deferrisomatales bacterium]